MTFEDLLIQQHIECLAKDTQETMTFYSEDGTPITAHLTESSGIFFTAGQGVGKVYLITHAELTYNTKGKHFFSGGGYTNRKYRENEYRAVKYRISAETAKELYPLIAAPEED